MRIIRRFTPLLAMGLLAPGCSEVPTEAPLAPEQSSARQVQESPEQSSGAMIQIDEVITVFFNFDAKRGLLSIHGGGAFRCVGQLSIADRMIVATPSEIRQRLVQIKDEDSWVSVHHATALSDAFPDLCGFLSGPSRISSGEVRHTQTFTNASFAAHWGGTLETPSGGSVHLSEVYQLTADAHDPNNPASWQLNAVQVLISAGT